MKSQFPRIAIRLACLSAFGCAIALPRPAFAQAQPATASDRQPSEPAHELSVFEVTSTRDIGYQSTNAAEVTRMDTPIVDIPMNVTVFNNEFMEDILAIDTTDVLKYDAGTMQTSENDAYNARGFESVGANFLNGFSQPTGFGSQSVANVERVEIIKGPAAVLYGQGGFGATINRITKRPQPNAKTNTRFTLSSFENWRFALDNTGPVPGTDGRFLYRLNLEYLDGRVYRQTPNKRLNIAPSLTWNITPKTQLTLEWIYDHHDRQGGWAFPMHAGDPHGIILGNGEYAAYGEPNITFNSAEDYRINTRNVGGVDLRHSFHRNFQFRSQFQYGHRDQKQQEVQLDTEAITILNDAVLMARSWRQVPRETENYRTRNEFIWKVKTGPVQHRLLFGHAWDQQYDTPRTIRSSKNFGGFAPGSANLEGPGRNSATGNRFNSFPNLTLAQFMANPKLAGYNPNLLLPINVFDIPNSPVVPDIASRPPLYNDASTKTVLENNELYINELLSFAEERFFIQAGMRRTETDRRNVNRLSGSFPNKVPNANARWNYTSAEADTFSTGFVWHLTPGKTLSLYGNMNSSFVPEFRSQPDGTPLDPQEGNQMEVGIKYSLLDGKIQGLLTYFDIEQENVYEDDPFNDGYFIALSDMRSKGYEAGINARPTENWQVFGSYAFVDSASQLTGERLRMQPQHAFRLFNQYKFQGALKGLYASLGSIYSSSTMSNYPATRTFEPEWKVPAYWRFDAIVGYKLRPVGKVRYSVALNVKNALDNREIYFVATPDRWTVESGREILLNLSAAF